MGNENILSKIPNPFSSSQSNFLSNIPSDPFPIGKELDFKGSKRNFTIDPDGTITFSLIHFKTQYLDREGEIKFKLKIDNWTIDVENKVLVLNDLKTTGKPINNFMEKSFVYFNYSRQFAAYLYVLVQYCKKVYDFNFEDWSVKCNVIVVETSGNNDVGVFTVSKELIDSGRKEFCKLLKMVAYCELFGFDDSIIFI